jgi:hypothetical protein
MTLPTRNEHLKRSRLQERRGAKEYGGSRNSGSGSGWVRKADVRTDDELIEFKTTSKGSFSLKSSDLRKLWEAALLDGRLPLFEVEFARDGVSCVILEKNDFMEMREKAAYPFMPEEY